MQKQSMKVVYYDLNDLLPIALTLVVTGLVVAYGLQIQGDATADMTTNSAEQNASKEAAAATAKIPSKLGTVVTITMAAVVIGVLLKAFVFNK